MMKIGTKIGFFSSREYIERIKNHVDFFELYVTDDYDYRSLKELGLEFVVHAAHQGHDVNLADPDKSTENKRLIGLALKAADYLNATKVIIHPGETIDRELGAKLSATHVKKLGDSRICVENMPITTGEGDFICASPDEVRVYMKDSGADFCLDVAHCFEYCQTRGIDPWESLAEFMALRPVQVHLNDTTGDGGHLSLGDGTLDIPRIIKLLPKGASITLETPLDIERQIKEIALLRSIVSD